MFVAAITLGLAIYFLLLRPTAPQHHAASSVRLALLLLLAIVMSTSPHVQVPAPRTPDERKKQVTPPNGVPIVCAPDAGSRDDGGETMLAAPAPDERTANATMAVDYAATPDWVPGETVR